MFWGGLDAGRDFLELKAYADTRFGHGGWSLICQLARLEPREYALLEDYPDAEAIALVMAASQVSVQGSKKLDHSDQLKVRDRRRKLDVIYVRGWTSSGESSS